MTLAEWSIHWYIHGVFWLYPVLAIDSVSIDKALSRNQFFIDRLRLHKLIIKFEPLSAKCDHSRNTPFNQSLFHAFCVNSIHFCRCKSMKTDRHKASYIYWLIVEWIIKSNRLYRIFICDWRKVRTREKICSKWSFAFGIEWPNQAWI